MAVLLIQLWVYILALELVLDSESEAYTPDSELVLDLESEAYILDLDMEV